MDSVSTPASVESTRLPLHIGFPGDKRDSVNLSAGRVRVGADADNDVVLGGAEVASHHLVLVFRHKGWQLHVHAGAERVHVNARPVRELALLRLGDVVSVGGHKLLLLGPEEGDAGGGMDTPELNALVPMQAVCGLRCVAGPLAGRCLALHGELLLDASRLPGIVGCVHLRCGAGGVHFQYLDGAGELLQRNGVTAASGTLRQGDQLTWGRHRLVLETSGLPVQATAEVPPAAAAPPVDPKDDSDRREMVWLLGVAVVLAVAVAGLLLLRP